MFAYIHYNDEPPFYSLVKLKSASIGGNMAETRFIISSVNYPNKQKSLIHLIKINVISSIIESVVAYWLAHLPLVLEVSGL